MPAGIELQLATLHKNPPPGPAGFMKSSWTATGCSAGSTAARSGSSRGGNSIGLVGLSHLAADLLKLPVNSAWLDGEVVAPRADGAQRFFDAAKCLP